MPNNAYSRARDYTSAADAAEPEAPAPAPPPAPKPKDPQK
jgi:hypothetical protein